MRDKLCIATTLAECQRFLELAACLRQLSLVIRHLGEASDQTAHQPPLAFRAGAVELVLEQYISMPYHS